MSDDEQEIVYDDQELIEELEESINPINKSNESASDEQKTGKRAQKSSGKLRHPRQKFCARWQLEFPWLRPNKVNDSVGYCNICRRELVCKKSHLERHQRSFKHMRLQGFENVFTVNEPEAELIEAHTSGYLDNDNDNDYQVEEMLDDDDEHTTIKVESTRALSVNSPVVFNTKYDLKSRSKNIMKVKANHRQTQSPRTSYRNESIMQNSHSHYLEQESGPSEYTPVYASVPKKDSFDLFFESISASVKNLPPKLAAEVKSKVSQVITEFEIRAICEKEAEESAQQSNESGSSQVTNVLTIDSTINDGSNGLQQTIEGGVTHYVYTYQPKIQ